MPATSEPSGHGGGVLQNRRRVGHARSLLRVAPAQRFVPPRPSADRAGRSRWWRRRGGGGPSTGTVIGGRPGICTTVWPDRRRRVAGQTRDADGGGGGGGGMPLLTWIVMIEPGTVCPLGEVPTTVPAGEPLLTGVVWSATWKPASLEPLPGAVAGHAGDARHLRPGAAVDVARDRSAAVPRPEVGGDRLHRGEPGAGRFVAAEQVAGAALAQRERAQLAGRRSSRRRCSWPRRSWLVKPRNADDRWASVVPVLPDIGRFQPTEPAAPAAVPEPVSSLLIALASVLARPSGTTCSQVSVVTETSLPARSKTLSIGLGGHHTPPRGERGARRSTVRAR